MLGTKKCPRCGQELFEDMDVCYECLFEFSGDEEVVPAEAYAPTPSYGDAIRLHLATASVDTTIVVPEEGLVVGRGSACDVVLHTPAVSRRHVRIRPGEGCAIVQDLGARNPASIDGAQVREEATLSYGQKLLVCGSAFTLVDE